MKKRASSTGVKDQTARAWVHGIAVVICNMPPTVKIVSPREQTHNRRNAMTQKMKQRAKNSSVEGQTAHTRDSIQIVPPHGSFF